MAKKSGKNNARLPDVNLLLQAGFDPKTGLPLKYAGGEDGSRVLFKDIRKVLRVIDEQDAVNRFQWFNLPLDMSGQDLERLLYYKGQLAFFYLKELNKFFCLPYALSGGIDAYGRYQTIHPIPFASGSKEKNDTTKVLADYLATKNFDVLYDVVTPEELLKKPDYYLTECCVLLGDYSKQLSETVIPRCELNAPVIDTMATCIPYMNTALMNATGVTGVKVNTQDEAVQVAIASQAVKEHALEGGRYVPMAGNLNFQELATSQVAKAEEYLLAMQSLDNFRLSTYGLENGGLFQKKSHMLEAEQKTNSGMNSLVMRDGLLKRQTWSNIINSVWGTGTYCMVSEEALGADYNGDALAVSDSTAEQSPMDTMGGNDVQP